MAACDLVAPVCADHQQLLVLQPGGERGQEFARRRVGPLQIVQEHDGGRAPGDRPQRAANRLEHRRPIAPAWPAAALGKQDAQVARKRTAVVEGVRVDAERHPQRRSDRAVGRRWAFGRVAAHERHAMHAQDALDETRLPDTGLARDEHETPLPYPQACERSLQCAALPLTSDERGSLGSHRSHPVIVLARPGQCQRTSGHDRASTVPCAVSRPHRQPQPHTWDDRAAPEEGRRRRSRGTTGLPRERACRESTRRFRYGRGPGVRQRAIGSRLTPASAERQ
jgi:hypothetical protein